MDRLKCLGYFQEGRICRTTCNRFRWLRWNNAFLLGAYHFSLEKEFILCRKVQPSKLTGGKTRSPIKCVRSHSMNRQINREWIRVWSCLWTISSTSTLLLDPFPFRRIGNDGKRESLTRDSVPTYAAYSSQNSSSNTLPPFYGHEGNSQSLHGEDSLYPFVPKAGYGGAKRKSLFPTMMRIPSATRFKHRHSNRCSFSQRNTGYTHTVCSATFHRRSSREEPKWQRARSPHGYAYSLTDGFI